jgi:hypothetical protein
MVSDKPNEEKKVETQKLSEEDLEKAKGKGSAHGDPIFIVE